MRRILASLAMALCLACSATWAAELYVCEGTGNNTNDGSKEKPLKNLDTAFQKAKAGDTIRVAEGNYFGLRGKGYFEVNEPVEVYGGYAPDFSARDILKHRTLVQPDNESAKKSRKAMLQFKNSKAGQKIVVDGLIFDMGARNSYSDKEGKPEGVETGMLLIPPQKNGDDAPTVTEPIISFPATAAAGDVLIQNCVFLNGAQFAIQGGHKEGSFKILNNVFVANRMAAIEVFGTGGKKGPKGPTEKDGDVEIAYNTILFTWSRLKDFKDMGYGIRIMTNLEYNIHNNIIGMNVLTGVDDTRFNKPEWIKIDNNLFLLNKQAPMLFTEPGQGQLERVNLSNFGDLGLASATGNTDKPAKALPINKAYLEGFLGARYSEEADFDPNSQANVLREVMGLPKQGKLKTEVSMFGNRYPLEDALKLFGALDGMGAQMPK